MPFLKLMVERSGSDLFITRDIPIKIKLEGKIVSVGKTVMTEEMCKQAAYGIMNDDQKKIFEETLECDFAIAPKGIDARFRVNVFNQRGAVGAVLRLIPSTIPTLEELRLPEILKEIITAKRGLILMVGGTGSGKSTTLAAMIDYRNSNMPGHILTIEDPVEFSHSNKKSIINQREVGVDTMSYHNALKASLREAPDVILVGEVRERLTMEAALELSNTGHLAVSTLHANNTNQALERIINLFPQESHQQLYMDLALNTEAIISQRLVIDVGGKRCAAIEILMNTPHIAELIMKGELDEIKVAMQESGQKGMQTFDKALFSLYKEGRISLEEALSNADSRTNLEATINFA